MVCNNCNRQDNISKARRSIICVCCGGADPPKRSDVAVLAAVVARPVGPLEALTTPTATGRCGGGCCCCCCRVLVEVAAGVADVVVVVELDVVVRLEVPQLNHELDVVDVAGAAENDDTTLIPVLPSSSSSTWSVPAFLFDPALLLRLGLPCKGFVVVEVVAVAVLAAVLLLLLLRTVVRTVVPVVPYTF